MRGTSSSDVDSLEVEVQACVLLSRVRESSIMFFIFLPLRYQPGVFSCLFHSLSLFKESHITTPSFSSEEREGRGVLDSIDHSP